ncbi:hypothetical protein GCM10008927_29080 [Amylibacter ulvae]|uniref:MalK-like OB fold domain-containing protein n=1 Tax=Paramylibacter ulvae TaxID=1651968 RepID=A0ABQ3D7H0_9RHOB|nr:hypothetical protein [Amylibacter ulvae]GHA61819.1 hypothetical protein GCM10008927_29080 [Amylibacter ulvae]
MSNLDAKLRGQMRAEIKRLHQRLKNTIIYVTHDQVEAMTLADKIVIMKDGRIEQQGTPDEVFHDPDTLFVAGFMGSPPMNLIECVVTKNGIKLSGGEIACDMPAGAKVGDQLVFGIRSDDIRPTDDGFEGVEISASVNLIDNIWNISMDRLPNDPMTRSQII